jgi:hypothetical protein
MLTNDEEVRLFRPTERPTADTVIYRERTNVSERTKESLERAPQALVRG